MVATADRPPVTWELFRNSGEPRRPVSLRADFVTTALSMVFSVGLFVDAYAHANLPGLETFFTPWHAVFYGGFAATAAWILWLVRGQVRAGRRGSAAVPLGYGGALVALPVFAVSGAADLAWHELIGIEVTTDIFFSPSHLGLITAMVVILTSPVRAAWARHPAGSRPSLGALAPAVVTLGFATSLVLLFLTYGNALVFSPDGIVESLSERNSADFLAASMVITTVVLVAPLLLLARRWYLPPGAATITFAMAAAISSTLTGFQSMRITMAAVLAGVLVDLLGGVLRPAADRRTAYWLFGALAPVLTWAVYLAVASVTQGRLPAVTEFWTGLPLAAGLVGWLVAALMVPERQVRAEPTPPGMA